MAATTEHTEEHATKIHNEEDAHCFALLPIEPQTHYQEDDIYYPTNNS